MMYTLRFSWGISRGRDTYGYNICSLYVHGTRVASCNGGGYDMEGTCLGSWIARAFKDRLLKLRKEFYGLTFHNPDFDPGKAEVEGETVEEREEAGKSIGLERYQAFYRASSKLPTRKHRVPLIDGACGMSSVQRILEAVGGSMRLVRRGKRDTTIYEVVVSDKMPRQKKVV